MYDDKLRQLFRQVEAETKVAVEKVKDKVKAKLNNKDNKLNKLEAEIDPEEIATNLVV
jgi:hypothetical protein